MGKDQGLPRDFDLVTKRKEDKSKWKWLIRVDQLRYYFVDGKPVITGHAVLPEFIQVTTGDKNQEFELLDTLTTDRGNFGMPSETKLYKVLQHWPDQWYRLTIFKQSVTSRVTGSENYGFWGWWLISKNKDQIFWETRYPQCGILHPWNLERRDPVEDTRRKHVNEIPSGGLDYKW